MRASMVDGASHTAEAYLRHADGHRLPVLIRAAPVRDDAGRIVGATEVFSDNTQRLVALTRASDLERSAYIDHLTGLANRRYTEECLANRQQELERFGWPFGVGFVDINDFKRFNDTYGHDVGDRR